MEIALMEYLPILEEFLLFSLRSKPYFSSLRIQNAVRAEQMCALALSGESHFPGSYDCEAGLYLVSSASRIAKSGAKRNLLTYGMNLSDAVTLSSIRENEAMLCLQQETVFCGEEIFPFERKIPFNRHYSVEKNIAVGFAVCLTDHYFGEEKWS